MKPSNPQRLQVRISLWIVALGACCSLLSQVTGSVFDGTTDAEDAEAREVAEKGRSGCCYRMTSTVTVVVWVLPPPVAVMVMGSGRRR